MIEDAIRRVSLGFYKGIKSGSLPDEKTNTGKIYLGITNEFESPRHSLMGVEVDGSPLFPESNLIKVLGERNIITPEYIEEIAARINNNFNGNGVFEMKHGYFAEFDIAPYDVALEACLNFEVYLADFKLKSLELTMVNMAKQGLN